MAIGLAVPELPLYVHHRLGLSTFVGGFVTAVGVCCSALGAGTGDATHCEIIQLAKGAVKFMLIVYRMRSLNRFS